MSIFNETAQQYDEWYKEKKGGFIDKIETDLAFAMIETYEGMKILDIGCGTGNFSMKLAKMGCRVTGIDVSQKMLDVARAKASQGALDIAFITMDAADLKFADNEFDAVVSMAAFEFIKDVKIAVSEIFRVVKAGGQILIGTINRESEWGEFYRLDEVREGSVFKYAEFKSLEEIMSWKPEKLLKTGECLYVSPFAEESLFNDETEEQSSKGKRGGFICALWEK